MKLALSLLTIYFCGKVYAVTAHQLWAGPLTPLVLLWQDALVAALILLAWRINQRAAWVLYLLALLHFTLSLPLLRLFATPLTPQIMSAGGGALSDSIRHHLDFTNIILLAFAAAAGVALPVVFRDVKLGHPTRCAAIVSVLVLGGISFTSVKDLQGMHRNSLVAFYTGLSAPRAFFHPTFQIALPAENSLKFDVGACRGANLLLVGLESTGTRYLAPYGASVDPMPFLTELAHNSLVFENAYAPYPESIKGLYSVLHSKVPRFGLNTEDFRDLSDSSLARVCRGAGYETALFHSGRFMYLGMDELVAGAGFDIAEDAGAIGGNHNSSFGVDDFATVDRVLNWVINSEAPYFIHYLPIAGHHPYVAPIEGPFPETDDSSRYLNALHYSDLALRRLIEGLDKNGSLANTLVVIYGDHGEAFGEHPGNFGHTLYLYEENVRVPLIISAPGRISGGRAQRIVSLADLAPTLCDLLGLQMPPSFEGLSALRTRERAVFFVTEYSMHLSGLRFGPWKFIDEHDSGYARLFNLAADPWERTNLANLYPEMVRGLRGGIFEWSGPAPTPTLSGSPNVAQR